MRPGSNSVTVKFTAQAADGRRNRLIIGRYPLGYRAGRDFTFFRAPGFVLHGLKTDRGHGCNEFVFVFARGDAISRAVSQAKMEAR
jgi:hypothetical protein